MTGMLWMTGMTTTTRTIIGTTTMNRMTWFTEITGARDDCDETEK